jgi:hypothetical protein
MRAMLQVSPGEVTPAGNNELAASGLISSLQQPLLTLFNPSVAFAGVTR